MSILSAVFFSKTKGVEKMPKIKYQNKTLTIRMPESLITELSVAANMKQTTVSQLVRDILAEIMKAHRAARDGDE